jgi:hypothetical protein
MDGNNAKNHSMLEKLVFKVGTVSNKNQLKISKQLSRNNQLTLVSMLATTIFNITRMEYSTLISAMVE